MVDRLTNLIDIFEKPELDLSQNRAGAAVPEARDHGRVAITCPRCSETRRNGTKRCASADDFATMLTKEEQSARGESDARRPKISAFVTGEKTKRRPLFTLPRLLAGSRLHARTVGVEDARGNFRWLGDEPARNYQTSPRHARRCRGPPGTAKMGNPVDLREGATPDLRKSAAYPRFNPRPRSSLRTTRCIPRAYDRCGYS
jgi:hypothetical protein